MARATDVHAALIRAAVELTARQSPSSISGRQLAAAAGVNYGQIHHYFGGKAGVFREAMNLMVRSFTDALSGVLHSGPGPADEQHPWLTRDLLWRSLANFAGDPSVLSDISWDYPRMRKAEREAARRYPQAERSEIRICLALTATLALGWIAHQQFVTSALRLQPEEVADIDRRIAATQDNIWFFGEAHRDDTA